MFFGFVSFFGPSDHLSEDLFRNPKCQPASRSGFHEVKKTVGLVTVAWRFLKTCWGSTLSSLERRMIKQIHKNATVFVESFFFHSFSVRAHC